MSTETKPRKRPAHRKRKWPTIVGAIVVLGTFIVKDILVEMNKDLVNSLSSANSTFSSRQEFRRLSQAVALCNAMLVRVQSRLESQTRSPKQDGSGEILAYWQTRVFQLGGLRELFLEQLGDLRDLNGKMPKRSRLPDSAFAEFNARFKQFDQTLGTVQGNPYKMVEDKTAYEKIEQLNKLASDLGNASFALAGKVSESARNASEHADNTLRRVTYLSYVLYALGWSLALWGHVSGIGGVSGE